MRPPQYEPPEWLGNWVGGVRVIASHTQWYFSVPQFIAIMGLAYYEFTLLQELPLVGTSIWSWIGFMFIAGITVLYAHYAFVYPSMQIFQNNQSQQKSRSPLYRRTLENGESLDELKRELHALRDRVDDAEEPSGGAD